MPASPTQHLWSTVNRAVSPALAAALAPPAAALGMVLVWMLQALPIPMMREAAARQGPDAAALTLVGITLAQALLFRSALRAAWRQPVVDLLDRQPLPWWSWSVALVPMTFTVAGAGALVALLWPWANPALGALLLLGQGGALAFAQARPDAGRWGWSLALAALFGGLTALARQAGPIEEALCALGGLAGLVLVGPMRLAGARRVADEHTSSSIRPSGPLRALVIRDGLALWRLDRGRCLLALLGPALGWPLLRGLAGHGLAGEDLELAALVLVALASPLLAMALSQLGLRLGRDLDVPEWPVSASARALTLTAPPLVWSVAATTTMMSAAPHQLGPWAAARLLASGVATAGLASLMLGWQSPARLNMGMWCLAVTLLCVTRGVMGRSAAPVDLALGGLGVLWAAARIERARRERT